MLRTLPADSPCRARPWAALPVGARFLCVAAALLWAVRPHCHRAGRATEQNEERRHAGE